MPLFSKKHANEKQVANIVLKDYYLQSNNLADLLEKDESAVSLSPTYLAGLQLLSGELARFRLLITAKGFDGLLASAKVPGKVINGEYEVLRYIYARLLDTGRVAIIVYNDVIISDADNHKIIYNKAGEYTGIDIAGVKVSKDRVILINLSDARDGGFRDWLKDVIDLERYLITYMSAYSKSFGLFGAYKVNTETLDEKTAGLLQSLLAEARRKLQKGVMPVLPAVIDASGKEMGWQAVELIQDYIVKTIARVMGIPLLALQARESGAYALAKEERAMWYETSLQGYVELVRCAVEKWLREQVDVKATVMVDTSDIDYLNEKREWTANEIAILLAQGVIDEKEARKLLGIDEEVSSEGVERNITPAQAVVEREPQAVETQKEQKPKRKKASVKKIDKQIVEEDARIHEWHANTIQPLERIARDDLLSSVNKAIEKEIMEQAKGANVEIVKETDEADPDSLNMDKLLEAINNAVVASLIRNYKRAIKRALTINVTGLTDVFISPERLYDGLDDMIAETAKWIGKQTAELIANKVIEMRNSGRGYNWRDVVEELQKAGISKERATTIARTEINRASNYAHDRNAEEAKRIAESAGMVVLKRWSTAMDERVRESHVQAGLVGWIPYEQNFPNGLSRPYHPDAPAKETVNCRCVLLVKTVSEDEED